MSDLESKMYAVEDLIFMIDGVQQYGVSNVDEAITFKYDEKRYTLKETLYGAGRGQFAISKKAFCNIKTDILEDTFKTFLALLNTKTMSVLTVMLPGKFMITFSSAAMSDIGTLSLGKTLGDQDVELTGILDIVPLL